MAALLNKLGVIVNVLGGRLLSSAGAGAGAEPLDYPFVESDVARLHGIAAREGAAAAPSSTIDAPTWQGMLLPAYFEQLGAGASIFGKQLLYRDLRDGVGDAERAALAVRLQSLHDHPQLAALAAVVRPLRDADTEPTAALFDDALPPIPAWAGKCWLLALGLALSVAGAAWTPLAWLAAFFFLFQMLAMQARYHAAIDRWDRQRATIALMLRSCSLAGAAATGGHPALAPFADVARQAGRINRRLHRSPAQALSIIGVYLDWFLQANVEHYFKTVRVVAANLPFLRQCLYLCARLDADLALARQRARFATCWATCGDQVTFDDVVHPLIAAPSALSIALGGGAFISGQNGVGKSTLLRTVGINLLVARAFGFCYASRAVCPMLPVFASMQAEDAMLQGASLYVAELTRARELLALGALHAPAGGAIFIIDEIFRGTNHLESVSSAAAVLDELALYHLVLVSSHNLVLASLLAHRLSPICVMRAGADGEGVLTLAPEVLTTTNGISLLEKHGFGDRIDDKARRVFAWLETFLAQPPGGASVLAPPAVAPARAA